MVLTFYLVLYLNLSLFFPIVFYSCRLLLYREATKCTTVHDDMFELRVKRKGKVAKPLKEEK